MNYARPLTKRGREISILDADGKSEIYWLDSLDTLDPTSRAVAEEALHDRYRISIISEVTASHVNHGHRYLRVNTNRGERYFNLREPGKNVTRLSDDHLVIRDSMGNRYEIPSVSALNETSQEHLERVL